MRLARAFACLGLACVALGGSLADAAPRADVTVGRQADGSVRTPTDQVLTPTGRQVEFSGRPKQVAVHPSGQTMAVLADRGGPLVVLDLVHGTLLQQPVLPKSEASIAGLAYSPDGTRLFASLAKGVVLRMDVGADGKLSKPVTFPLPEIDGVTDLPAGLALSAGGRWLYVALNLSNRIAVLDATTGRIRRFYNVGVAPWDILRSGNTLAVANRGGRRPRPTDRINFSGGYPVVSTKDSGAAATGTVSLIDLAVGSVRNIRVGLHPARMAAHGRWLLVPNANSDSVSVVDLKLRELATSWKVTPFPGAPFGSSPNAVTVLDSTRVLVTLGRNNALAVYGWSSPSTPASFEGLLPTAWYPADVAIDRQRKQIVVANDEGVGALGPDSPLSDPLASATGRKVNLSDPVEVTASRGTLSLLDYPTPESLAAGSQAVARNNDWASAIESEAAARAGVLPKAIPERVGEPSLIKHVFYVIKENRTYDQILGDDPRGDGDPRYLQFDSTITPNQHLLARRWPLFDNFYVSGSFSPDGHQWATQAYVTDYLQRSYDEFGRGYSFNGSDALAYAPSGFLWENAERFGHTVRVYGEFANRTDASGTRSDIPSLDRVLVRDYPRWNLNITDRTRASMVLQDLDEQIRTNSVPDLTIIQLPRDHTQGLSPDKPTPEAEVSDNDNALGDLVQKLSLSSIWDKTAVFVVEDDAQSGLDHIDGHRTTAFIASPYARKDTVDSTYYTQINMVRTIEQILGLPPMNQMDLAAAPMSTAFTDTPDTTPFIAVPAATIHDVNPPLSALTGVAKLWAQACAEMNFEAPDAAPEQLLNRAIWYSLKGFVPYPGDGAVLTPAQVMARYAGVEEEEEEEAEERETAAAGRGAIPATGLASGVTVTGFLLLLAAAVSRRRAAALR